MKILNDELDKSLKKKNQINLWVIIGSTVLLAVILFLLIFYQSSSRQLLFSILCTVFTVIYLLVIWILIYASMTPIHRYRKVIKIYNSRPPQHLVLQYLSTKEEVETINRIGCHCHVFLTDDGREGKTIFFYTEESEKPDFVENEFYDIYYYQHFIGEYNQCKRE